MTKWVHNFAARGHSSQHSFCMFFFLFCFPVTFNVGYLWWTRGVFPLYTLHWLSSLNRKVHTVATWQLHTHTKGQETRGRRNCAHRGCCDVTEVSCTCCTCGIMLKMNRSWSCGLLVDTSYWKQGSQLGNAPPAPPHLPGRDGKTAAWRWWPRPPAPLMPPPPAESSHLPVGGCGNWSSCQLCP